MEERSFYVEDKSVLNTVIETVPFAPEDWRLEFLAKGLPVPNPRDESATSIEQFLRDCFEQGVIPYTSARLVEARGDFEWTSGYGLFYSMCNPLPEDLKKRVYERELEGGQMHERVADFYGSTRWNRFKAVIYPDLKNAGYEISDGRLDFFVNRGAAFRLSLRADRIKFEDGSYEKGRELEKKELYDWLWGLELKPFGDVESGQKELGLAVR